MSNKNKFKTIFFGSPDFAVPALESLVASENFDVLSVVTQTDKASGRGQKTKACPVKISARKLNIPVIQPEKISDLELKEDLDFIIVSAYGKILPKKILEKPKFGCINIHASLLPFCRGASCIQGAILAGKEKSGITFMKMDEGLDTGPILAQFEVEIEKKETAQSLHDKLANLAGEKIIEVLKKYAQGDLPPAPQPQNNCTYSPALKKEDGRIDWNEPARKIEKKIRAFYPWPGTFCFYEKNGQKKLLKIISADVLEKNFEKANPGEFFNLKNYPTIQTGQNSLILKKVKPEGKQTMDGKDFLQGNFLDKLL